MRFRILGPIECYAGDRRCELGGPRQLSLLAVLLIHANRAVSADRLIDAVWGEERSPGAAKRLQMAIARLRRAIDASGQTLRTVSSGYLLAVPPDELDADAFVAGVRQGRRAVDEEDPARAVDVLGAALGLWRGPALAEVAYADFAQAEIQRLEELRLSALEARIEADLRLGRHDVVVGELDALVAEHPLRETLHARRMLALYRCGRQAEALEAYQAARRVLIGDIGIEPGAALQQLHEAILGHDDSLELREHSGGMAPAALGDLTFPGPLAAAAGSAFAGRGPELARMLDLWDQPSPATRAVVVAGEAGIGKTRLAGEFCRAAAESGALVLYGRCDEGLAVPYQPFVEALGPVVAAIGPSRLRTQLASLTPELSRLWPELASVGEPSRADPETERYRLFEAVAALVGTATGERRVLLVLDDLHWAAQPTLLMLRHVVRSERTRHALIVGTCRETEIGAGHPLPRLLADLRRDASAIRVHIGGLDERAIGELLDVVGGPPAEDFVRRLRIHTGGNPFFIREVLARLDESRPRSAGDRWPTDVPVATPLRQVIDQRVARLSAPAREAVGVAAVAGPAFSIALLEVMLGERADLDGIDEAVAAGLLVEAAPREFTFVHDLVRQTVYEGHGSVQRMRMHRQVGEALEQLVDGEQQVEALAHHFAQAAAYGGSGKAVGYAIAAGRHATARLAYEDAAAHYERALKLAPRDDARRDELLLALADVLWCLGEMDRARDACRDAAELAGSRGEPERMAQAALGFAGPVRFEVAAAVTEPLIRLLERALETLDDTDSALRARVLGRLASAVYYAGGQRRGRALADRALEMARRAGDKRALADVLATSYIATRGPDDLETRRARSTELARLAAEVGDGALAALARSWILVDLIETGAVDEAERALAELERLANALQQRFPRFLAVGARARRAHLDGRLADYEALAHEVLALGQRGQDEAAAQAFGAQMLSVRREQGRLGELLDAVEAFVERFPAVPSWRCALALVHADLDHREEAIRQLEVLARNDFSDLPRDWLWLVAVSTVSEVIAYVGDVRRAELLYPLLAPYANRNIVIDGPFCQGSAARPLALLAATMGRFDAAARHFERALEMNGKLRSPLWVARTQCNYAETLLCRGGPDDRDHARALLDAALPTADALGLEVLADKARQLASAAATPT
jgi:DNA-binding SARP family transcriptional activator